MTGLLNSKSIGQGLVQRWYLVDGFSTRYYQSTTRWRLGSGRLVAIILRIWQADKLAADWSGFDVDIHMARKHGVLPCHCTDLVHMLPLALTRLITC